MTDNYHNYELFSVPQTFNRAPRELSTAEAKQYYTWFMEQIPARLQILQSLLDSVLPAPIFASQSELALVGIGAWLDTQLHLRKLGTDEIEKNEKIFPEWIHSSLPTSVLCERSISLCIDIGIYFGQMIIYNHPNLIWDYVRKPKSDAYFQKPVVSGFPKKMKLNPIQIVYVVANRVIEGVSASDELPKIYNVWSSMVSESQIKM